jgi:hypothetical protein
VKLEDLTRAPAQVERLMAFLGLDYCADDFAAFARPHNVNRPEDQLLSTIQRRQFEALAAPMMAVLGYANQAEYIVNY